MMAEQMMQNKADEVAIAQIIPAGYKWTEVGLIPESWELTSIKSISAVPMQNGLFFEPKRKGKGVPLINVSDMYETAPINVERLELFDATISELKKFKAMLGDLFFTRSSVVPTGIAFCNIFNSSGINVVFDSHLIRVRPNTDIVEPQYLYLNCIYKHARNALISEAKTAIMTTIDQGAINRCPVLLPPKKEQTAIANALSDMDAFIVGLEQLFAKKQAIKTATMQQLLTGRTRLPQFALRPDGTPKGYKSCELGPIPEDWSSYEIGSFSPFITSGSRGWADFYSDYGDLFVRITNTKRSSIYLDLSDSKYVKLSSNVAEASRTSIAVGDILISITADIGICTYIDDSVKLPAYINQHLALVRFNTSLICSKFVAYFLASERVQSSFLRASDQGAKAGMNLDSVRKIKIIVPTEKEQTAIATILSDMDNELTALEQKLAKARDVKQGMMQQLLTGRIRLPLPQEA
ncbi:restriction endonuclease subunit S [Aeromonas veronii]|uniref:Restriction endonuclease subunit S n=1 Tax=Aeromonas veronii TaxID=654 RepID=A0A3A9IZL0_AERVE|nr:restriction endonuclease subunit S [Aeromonas veronii]RKJ92002.1 restriction endonuclease subunit S [Aeromonas veronii]